MDYTDALELFGWTAADDDFDDIIHYLETESAGFKTVPALDMIVFWVKDGLFEDVYTVSYNRIWRDGRSELGSAVSALNCTQLKEYARAHGIRRKFY